MWIEKKINPETNKVKYLFREKYNDNLTGKKRTISVTFDKNTRETRTKAQKILLSRISLRQQDSSRSLKTITFENLANKWFEYYKKQVKDSTVYSVQGQVKIIIEMVGKDTLPAKITPQYLRHKFEEIMFSDTTKHKVSTSYARSLKSRLNAIFNYGIDHHYLIENPIDKLKIPNKKKEAHVVTEFFLEEDELKNVMNYLKNHNMRYYLFCQWLYLNGLRFGEAAAMLKSDVIITEERSYCKVTGTLDYAGKKTKSQTKSSQTKTSSGMREVELNSQAIKIFQEACKLSKNSEYIFTTSKQTPLSISALNTYFRTHKDKMNLSQDKRISTHIFRHTHVSKLAELDIPLHIIQRRVGHASEDITRDIYLHITSKAKDKTKKLLELL
ncbi:tyrosine-type recombinase/integrase [Lactococcus garvieae]|nr:tyrosine-type recombinase/integrase [Lactococcus garvieae]